MKYDCPDHMLVRHTDRGVCVVELGWRADPAKTGNPHFERDMIRLIGVQRWKREFERDWATAGGERYYSEFDPARNVKRLDKLIDAPVIRGWDFGKRNPACVWGQYSPTSRRFWLLREILPYNMNVYNLRDLVRYLSGQLPLDALRDLHRTEALSYIESLDRRRTFDDKPMPQHPWFSGETHYWDYAGHEANMTSGLVETQAEEVSWKDVLAAEGIQLGVYMTRESSKEVVIRKLLQTLPDGMPGFLMDPACPLCIEGYAGGISFNKPTAANPNPGSRANDGKYEHLDDAIGYSVVNVVPIEDGGRATPADLQRLGVAMRGQDWRPGHNLSPPDGEGLDSGLLEAWK